MRIGVNTRILIEGKLEGVGLFTHEVMRRLVELRPDDEFVFFFDRPPSDAFIYNDRVEAVVIPPPTRHPVLWYWWFEHRIPAALRKHRTDLFFSPDGYGSTRCPVPSATVIHDLAFRHFPDHLPPMVRWFFNRYTPRYVEQSEAVLTVSDFSKRDMIEAYGTDPAKITVVGNGTDRAIRPLGPEAQRTVREKFTGGKPYFIYIGSVHPRKNTARLLEAFEAFREKQARDVKLVLAGRWAWKTGPARKVLDRMGHREDVITMGHLDREALGLLLAASEALVYPSLFEGFGIPVLEALHAEVPVITSESSSMAEVAGRAALYVDPQDAASIAAAMERISADAALAAKLVEYGRAERQRYSWDLTAERVSEVIGGLHPA